MEYIRRRGMDKDCERKHYLNVQHQVRARKRQIPSENSFHAYGQERQDRDHHGLQ